MHTAIESLFPRYLFIHLDDIAENWAPIRSTRGVAGLVRSGASIPSVPDYVIDCLQQNLDSVGCIPTPPVGYQPGDKSRVLEGPFSEAALTRALKYWSLVRLAISARMPWWPCTRLVIL